MHQGQQRQQHQVPGMETGHDDMFGFDARERVHRTPHTRLSRSVEVAHRHGWYHNILTVLNRHDVDVSFSI